MLATLDSLIQEVGGSAGNPEVPASLGRLGPLVQALLHGAAPRESLLGLRKLLQADPSAPLPQDGPALESVAAVLCSGPDLARMLARDPRRLQLLLDPGLGRPWTREELDRALDHRLQGAESEDQIARGLTRFRNDQFVRLAACEFGRATLEQVGQELSRVADVCLQRALTLAIQALSLRHGPPLLEDGQPCTVAVIGMGKYGARELNFCSDIDVVLVYRADEGSAGELSLNELYSRVCQMVVRLLSEPNPEGYVFRVDLRLRPEGSRGPLCNSLASAERYYETWGVPWDRLAWLKARPAAGDLALGQELVDLLRPFVYPRSLRPEIVEQILELNRRIKEQPSPGGWNVKLGTGGIRDVEFFVQSLQLLHAGKQQGLQVRGTLEALDRLLFAGLISEQEQRQLAGAYDFWRRIEHRLQLHGGRQTHLLPDDGPIRRQLSLHLGLGPSELDRQVAHKRAQVQAIYATLGAAPREQDRLTPLLSPDLEPERAQQILQQAGFQQAGRAAQQIQLLASKPWGPLSRSAADPASALALLDELSRSPDPDAALGHLTQLGLRYGPYRGLWQMLEQNPSTLRLLLSLFGSSDFLARLFIAHPELLDELLMAGRARQAGRPLAELQRQLRVRLEAAGGDQELQLVELRRFRNEETLRIGLNDIAGELAPEAVWSRLSDLADAILGQLYPLVLDETRVRYGQPRLERGQPAVMCVVGLGKLGGQELTYGSDLDLIFVHSGAGATDGSRSVTNDELFTRLAQRFINGLTADMGGGRLYEVDTRLRPSGNQGTLVSSLAALQDYHRRSAQVWERQALIKARVVAGDPGLGRQIEAWIQQTVHGAPAPDPAALKDQVHALRQRMQRELGRAPAGFADLKLGRGGLAQVEAVAQYLQLCHGARDPSLRCRSTLGALQALQAARLLDAEQAQLLADSYRFLRRLEARLRMVRDRPAERLPLSGPALEVMARRMGYREQAGVAAGSQLLEDYQRRTASIHVAYERVLGHEQ